MARLSITIAIDEDPAYMDPYELAENIIDTYNEEIRLGNLLSSKPAEFLDAEWA